MKPVSVLVKVFRVADVPLMQTNPSRYAVDYGHNLVWGIRDGVIFYMAINEDVTRRIREKRMRTLDMTLVGIDAAFSNNVRLNARPR